MLKNTNVSYGSIAKLLHWLIFILLAGLLLVGYYMDELPKAYKATVYNYHKLTGITVFVLMLLRLMWTLTNPKPTLPYNVNPFEKLAEHTVHWMLYLTVIAMPIAGWVGSSAVAKYPHIGSWALSLPVEQSKSLAKTSFMLHSYIAIAIITFASIHILAALYHHYIRQDNVLKRMLPW